MNGFRHSLPFGSRAISLVAALLLAGLGLLSACSYGWNDAKKDYDKAVSFVFDVRPTGSEAYEESETPIIDISYDAAEELADPLRLPKGSPIYVQAFQNLVDPADPAPFGRLVAEQVAAGLVQEGETVTAGEPRLPEPDMAPEEYPTDIMGNPIVPRPAVLTGNYVIGQDVVLVSATITGLEDDTVFSSYQWTVPVNDNTRMLLPQLIQPSEGLTPTVRTSF